MSTTAKFSLDNPYYEWPKNPEMDVQILIQKLNRLRGTLSSNKWDNLLLLNPNNILRQIEQKNVSVLFVCSNDLKYAVHAAHLPFLCRLNNTKLVVLKAGSAIEMHSYFGNNNLFMFGFLNSPEIVEFSNQFAEIEPLDVSSLPRTSIKK